MYKYIEKICYKLMFSYAGPYHNPSTQVPETQMVVAYTIKLSVLSF